MPEDMSDRMPEDMPDRMPEDLPDRMPEDMPEDMPDHMPEDMPDRMPNRMSEDMSDRMPEDLPVRKCINVMVGITRSKVIFFCLFIFLTSEPIPGINLSSACTIHETRAAPHPKQVSPNASGANSSESYEAFSPLAISYTLWKNWDFNHYQYMWGFDDDLPSGYD